MGEKIRDIEEITIGNNRFLVELNEGYDAKQGRIIHLQNNNFRYLFTESEFYQICAEILYSESKLSEMKKKENIVSLNVKTDNSLDESKNIPDTFAKLLNQNDIEYRVLELGKEYITILVNPECRKKFKKIIASHQEFVKLYHPFGKFFDNNFLYQMHEFDLYKYDNEYFEIFYELPCRSLKEKTWIPLDRFIQNRIWTINLDNHRIDPISYFIFRLCWAVFVDRGFSKTSLYVIEKNKKLLKSKEMVSCLNLVFFEFTNTMIKMLEEKKYNKIVEAYFSFLEY